VNEYLVSFNASDAAKKAGYKSKANVIGSQLLANPSISAEINARIEQYTMSANEVLTRLSDIARGDLSDLMSLSPMGFTFNLLIEDEQGNRIPNPKNKLIKRIKQKVTTITGKGDEEREIIETDLELYSAQEALNTLAKHHALLVDRTELSGKDGAPIEIKTVEILLPPDDNG